MGPWYGPEPPSKGSELWVPDLFAVSNGIMWIPNGRHIPGNRRIYVEFTADLKSFDSSALS